MVYKFRIISDENETFLRTIEIQENDTFLHLHEAIFAACDFTSPQMTSFFISNNDWEKLQEITLLDMMDDTIKTIPMNKAIIHDYVNTVEDKLIYSFDFFADRALFCTLIEIKEESSATKYPICTHAAGNAPMQLLNEEDEFSEMFNELENGEDFESLDEFDDNVKNEFDDINEFDDFGSSEFNDEF